MVNGSKWRKGTFEVSYKTKVSLFDLVPMLLTSTRRDGGNGGEVGGEINNWTDRTAWHDLVRPRPEGNKQLIKKCKFKKMFKANTL